MSQKRNNKNSDPTNSRSQKRAAVVGSKSVKPSLVNRLPKLPPFILCFAMVWIFSAIVYGDVFYMSEQNSFFVFDSVLMRNISSMQLSWLYLPGRMFLTLFHYPWLGGFVLSVLLTVSAWFVSYIFGLSWRLRSLAFALPFAVLLFFVSRGLNLYYQSEPSIIFYLSLIIFVCLALASLVKCIVARHNKQVLPCRAFKEETSRQVAIQNLVVLAFMVLTTASAYAFEQNTIVVSRMQRQLQQSDYEGMIETALDARKPNRVIAAYYAIALSQTNQLTERLFDIHYQFDDTGIMSRSGKEDGGGDMYAADCNFYSGLVLPAYHLSMERFVIDGPTLVRLKRMIVCAIVNNEKALARKYMHILGKYPFESDFIERYEPLIGNQNLIEADADLRPVLDVIPVEDFFEQRYRAPLFIGYNIALTSGRSQKALTNSLAACLYGKAMQNLIERTQPLIGQPLPSLVEQAVLIYGVKDKNIMNSFQFSPMAMQRFQLFLGAAKNYLTEREQGAEALRKDFGNYYAYYYYYENLPSKNTNKQEEDVKKGGVN